MRRLVDRHPSLAVWAGIAFFVGMMSVGYYYNVTFIQLGITDLGTRLVGLDAHVVARSMALLAVVTAVAAGAAGVWMRAKRLGYDLRALLRVAFGVVVVQTLLTAGASLVSSEGALLAWSIAAGSAIGVGVPATFALAVHLIPTRRRGAVAAAVTALAYVAAPLLSGDWTLDFLARQMLAVMVPGALALGWLAFAGGPLVATWARQHRDPAIHFGRYARPDPEGRVRRRGRLVVLVVLMFGVFFVDSLGFLRLVDTPGYMLGTWQSPETMPRMVIAIAHVAAAIVAGVLYRALGERHLMTWVFGLFVLIHLGYVLESTFPGDGGGVLFMPVLYAIAVSLYTVVAFAIWADLSTPATITVHAALGVAASAWMATFLSTALALQWQAAGVPLEAHFRWVEAIALVLFALMLVLAILPERAGRTPRRVAP